MKIIDQACLAALAEKSAALPRRRTNLNLHPELSDPIQRLLNAGHPDSYVRPHRHDEGRWELFTILTGALALLTFSDSGEVLTRHELRPGQTQAIEIDGGVWHSILFLDAGTSILEFKPGPYAPASDKDFARWAPPENSPDAPRMLAWMHQAQPGQAVPL